MAGRGKDADAVQLGDAGVFAMMFLGYFRYERGELRRREHVFACRPFLEKDYRKNPFCFRLSVDEASRFIQTSIRQYPEFLDLLSSFRSSTHATLSLEADIL